MIEVRAGQWVVDKLFLFVAPDFHRDGFACSVSAGRQSLKREASVIGINVFALLVDREAVNFHNYIAFTKRVSCLAENIGARDDDAFIYFGIESFGFKKGGVTGSDPVKIEEAVPRTVATGSAFEGIGNIGGR